LADMMIRSLAIAGQSRDRRRYFVLPTKAYIHKIRNESSLDSGFRRKDALGQAGE